MRKAWFVIIIVLLLAGCTNQNSHQTTGQVHTETMKILKADSKMWQFNQAISSVKTAKGLGSKLTTTSIAPSSQGKTLTNLKGSLSQDTVKYQPISWSDYQRLIKSGYTKATQKNIHFLTVKQVNQSLKALGCKQRITQLSDLVFFKNKIGSINLGQGFLAQGHRLYAITAYYYGEKAKDSNFNRGASYIDDSNKAKVKHVNLAKLNGTWIAPSITTSRADNGKLYVKDGFMYQYRYDSYERSAIEDLSKWSLTTLNQNVTYAQQKVTASNAGYQLGRNAVATGDSTGSLYIVVNQTKMIKISGTVVTEYQKSGSTIAKQDLPTTELNIFKQMDKQNAGSFASTITEKAGNPIVGMSSSIKYVTNYEAGQITENKVVTMQNGKLISK